MLIEFPCELLSAVMAGRWAAGATPFTPWMRGYWLRLAMAAAVTTLVRCLQQCFSVRWLGSWAGIQICPLSLSTKQQQ